MSKIKKRTLNFFLILIIGGLGGILADQFLLPYLATIPLFSKIGFIHQVSNGTTIINPTERIIITENTSIEQAISKINPCLVTVQSYQNKRITSQGTGFIVTSDGLIITAANLVPVKADKYLVFRNNHSIEAQVIKRDLENNLALLETEETNLPVVSLTDLENLQLGQRIILIGSELVKNELKQFVNLGIIRSIDTTVLKVNLIEEDELANGGPLINVKGEVIGLNLIDSKGLIKIIPVNKIKEFIEL